MWPNVTRNSFSFQTLRWRPCCRCLHSFARRQMAAPLHLAPQQTLRRSPPRPKSLADRVLVTVSRVFSRLLAFCVKEFVISGETSIHPQRLGMFPRVFHFKTGSPPLFQECSSEIHAYSYIKFDDARIVIVKVPQAPGKVFTLLVNSSFILYWLVSRARVKDVRSLSCFRRYQMVANSPLRSQGKMSPSRFFKRK